MFPLMSRADRQIEDANSFAVATDLLVNGCPQDRLLLSRGAGNCGANEPSVNRSISPRATTLFLSIHLSLSSFHPFRLSITIGR